MTISWGTRANESTCGLLSSQSDRWLGGALQLRALAEFAEPLNACNPLDNPTEPNVQSALPVRGFRWVTGAYSPPDARSVRVRTVECMGADGAVVNATLCTNPNVPDDELWRPAASTASQPLTGKIALVSRGVCTFVNKGSHSEAAAATKKSSWDAACVQTR